MKKLLVMLIMVTLIISQVSCGKDDDKQNAINTNDVQDSSLPVDDEKESKENGEETSNQEEFQYVSDQETEPKAEFEANADLEVVATFVYDNDTYVVVENVGEKAILNFKVAYVNFDSNGFATTTDSDGYLQGKVDAANLMPGAKTIAGWYSSSKSGSYAVAVVTSVDYADGSNWNATNINSWSDSIRASFSIENYKNDINAMKETAVLAETNEYASVANFSIVHRNQFTSSYDFDFSIKNTSDQGITSISIFVLEFDENGFPVSVSPYDTYCLNGHSTGGTINLAPEQNGEYTDNLFLDGTTSQIKFIIFKIQFQDGTEWFNPYTYEWIIANNNAY